MKKVFFTLLLAVSFTFISEAQPECWIAQGLGILSEEHIILDLSAVDDIVVWGLAMRLDLSQPVIIRSVNGGDDWETFDVDSLGKSATDLVRSIRLEKARKLLQTTRLSVSEVCFAVGFNNTSYFSTAFRKTFGVAPSEARK